MFQKETVVPELLSMVRFLQESELLKNHILVGGTALALQLGHRISKDIDLFSLNEQDNDAILLFLKNNFEHIEVLNNNPNILQIFTNNIKIDIISAKGLLLEKPVTDCGITVCHKKDIAGMKLWTITSRKEAKDYIDICYLLREYTLKELFSIFKNKYSQDNILLVKKALLESAKVNPYEWQNVSMLRNDIFISDIPRILNTEVSNYNRLTGVGRKFSFKSFFIRKI
jgi:predicted nucleotidyltransferase component of viral defense system